MKKLAVLFFSTIVLSVPAVSFAAINNLNGLTAKDQTFATSTAPTSSHLLVQSSGSAHTFKWDGTPWLLNQGGTGATAFATGSVPFILNGMFSENNLNLFWDNVKHALGVGNSNPQHSLDVSGALYSRLVTVSPSSSVTVDWNAGNVQTLTLSSNSILTFSNGQAGGEYKLILNQDATGGRSVTWPSSVKWENKTTPTLTSITNATDMASFVFQGTYYLGSFASNFGTSSPATVKALVVAGGGGGGATAGGGGGAGGYQYDATHTVSVQVYSVTVGAGGVGGGGGTQDNGIQGGNSVFDTIIATGGGYGGGSNASGNGGNGGSGGGAGNNNSTGGMGSQGSNGGDSCTNGGVGGGGGGATTAGTNGSSVGCGPGVYTGVAGGAGTANSISGASVTYAGGGGSGANATTGSASGGAGGLGGGGSGGNYNDSSPAVAGTANTGGGGGSGGYNGSFFAGAAGGSGVVIISYPTGNMTATGGTITTSGSNTIHTFTSNGTFTVTAI